MILCEIVRFLRRHRLLCICGASILTLGIGASTLALTFLMTFSSLSYPGVRPDTTATIAEETSGGGSTPITFERFERLRKSYAGAAHTAAYSALLPNAAGTPPMAMASSGFFSVFTEPLAAGRDFSAVEEGVTGHHAVILAYKAAERRFGSPANAVGQNVLLKHVAFEVVGVAPADFEGMYGESPELWVPPSAIFPLLMDGPTGTSWKYLNAFYAAATAPGRTTAQLTKFLHSALPATSSDEPRLHVSPGLTKDPMRDEKISARLRLGLALSILFTLVSGLNLAWLLLAQAPRRTAETRIKMALGADRLRLICEEMVGPATVVALGFLGAGIVVAAGMNVAGGSAGLEGQAARGAWGTALMAYGIEFPFALLLAGLVVFLPLLGLLKDDSRVRLASSSSAPAITALMNAPVVLQVSLTAATCILAGMVGSALITAIGQPLGYDPSGLTVVEIGPASESFQMAWRGDEVPPVLRAMPRVIAQAASIPGVRAAAYGTVPADDDRGWPVSVQRADASGGARVTVQTDMVSPGFFRTAGATLVEGRSFPSSGGGDEVVLNRTAARALFPNQHAVNRTVRIAEPVVAAEGNGPGTETRYAIVAGVVEDLRPPGYERHALPALYFSMCKTGQADFTPHLILNGDVSELAVEAALGRDVQAQLPGMKIWSVYRVRDRISKALEKDVTRTYMAIGAAFTMALVSSIGLYAALTYFVRSRRRELAIRVCLGASAASIRRLVYVRAARSAAVGILLSLPLWPLLAHLSSMDYVGAVSWSTGRAIIISGACIAVAVGIALLPGREATTVSPAQLLKQE